MRWVNGFNILGISAALTFTTVLAACGARDPEPASSVSARQPVEKPGAPVMLAPSGPPSASKLETALADIEAGLAEAARDRWDPEYVVQNLGKEPRVLFEWVRDNTYWIPYRGVLRGAPGVLNDRLGNSLDRAVLLATLLEKAGHTARLARRELSPRHAFDLALEAVMLEPAYPDEELAQEEEELVDPVLGERAQAIDAMLVELDFRVSSQTTRLSRAIQTDNALTEWSERFEAAMAALRDHWWVQVQIDGKWADLDMLESPVATAPVETRALSELAPLSHEIALRVIAEQWTAGKAVQQKVLEHVWRPAETIGRQVALQFWPSELHTEALKTADDAPKALRAMAIEQQEWSIVLAFGGEVAAHGALSETGESAGEQKGGAFGGLGAALSDDSSAESLSTLSAVWVEYELRAPGAEPRRIRRQVFDLLGPAARALRAPTFKLDENARLTRSLALTMRTDILPVNCAFSADYIGVLAAQALVANRALFAAATKGELAPGSAEAHALLEAASPAFSPLYTLALARFEWSRHSEQIYIDRLNVLARHRFLASTADDVVVREAIDVVANEVGVDLGERDGIAVRIAQGVFDTNAERLLHLTGRPLGNTAAAYEASNEWIVAPAGSTADRLQIPADAKQRIAADLATGYSVVAPLEPIRFAENSFVGWWRVDPNTGDTLGVGDLGWGQSMVERGALTRFFLNMAKDFLFDALLCQAIPVVVEAAAPMVADFFGTAPTRKEPRERASSKAYEQTQAAAKQCMISAIASAAAFATLPLLLKTLKFMGRGVRGMAGKLPGFRPKPPSVPRPPRMPRFPCIK